MGKLSSINHPVAELPVNDVTRAQEYYRDTFGFEINWLDPSKTIGAVSHGDTAIFLRQRKPPFEPVALWVFAENLDSTFNELSFAGANIVEPIEVKPWGLRQFTVEDQDSNRFYFHQG